jgi:signal transduction histidine kinase
VLRSTIAAATEAIRQLRDSKRRAEAATRTKSEFLANMSHELRTPMTAILGYTDLLLEEGDIERAPDSRIDQLYTLKRSGGHLMRILTDILDLSRARSKSRRSRPHRWRSSPTSNRSCATPRRRRASASTSSGRARCPLASRPTRRVCARS